MSPAKRSPETTAGLRASLVSHAQRLVARGGASALTMRALAADAGCAVGLPYKVFADRNDLVSEVIHTEFVEMRMVFAELVGRAGSGTIGGNLAWFAELVLASPAVALAQEVFANEDLMKAVTTRIDATGEGPATFEAALSGYLAAERRAGRVDRNVDVDALAFFVAGAIHNVIVSGPGYPRPTKRELERHLDALSARLSPSPQLDDDHERRRSTAIRTSRRH